MQWYYVANGQRQGPVTESEFQQLVANRSITNETLVWREGMSNWQPYASAAQAATGAEVPAAGVAGEETQVCAVSGKRYPVREMIQYEGKWISAEHRDQYFQRMREGVGQPGASAVPGPHGYGGFWRRFCAVFVDGIILWAVNQVFTALIGMLFGVTQTFGRLRIHPGQAGQLGRTFLMIGLLQGIGLAVALAYDIGFIRKFDATPGKMAMGMKLLRTDGSKLGVGRIIGRRFAKILSGMILAIGYIMAGVDDEKRALHDRICDTRVVKVRA